MLHCSFEAAHEGGVALCQENSLLWGSNPKAVRRATVGANSESLRCVPAGGFPRLRLGLGQAERLAVRLPPPAPEGEIPGSSPDPLITVIKGGKYER